MKNLPEYNKGSIVFVPDYVNKEIAKLGITPEKLYMISTLDVNERYDVMGKLATVLKNGVSGVDIKDISILNHLLYKSLYGTNVNNFPNSALSIMLELCNMASGGYIDDINNYNSVKEVINLYVNQKIDVKTILMNGNNKNELYTCDAMTDTLLVIIHDGFTNFIVENDDEVKNSLSVGLLDYYTQRLGKTSYEKSFLLTL